MPLKVTGVPIREAHPTAAGALARRLARPAVVTIAAAGVALTLRLLRLLEVGLTSEHFRPGSLGAADMAP